MSDSIIVKDVRVNFPYLFNKNKFEKYGAVLLFENSKDVKAIESNIASLVKENLKGKKPPSDKVCLKNGDDSDNDNYAGLMFLNTNASNRPKVLNGKTQVITDPDEDRIYSGCYVNAKISLWAQDNSYGKRINCELIAIQFSKNGDPLGNAISEGEAINGFDTVDDDVDWAA